MKKTNRIGYKLLLSYFILLAITFVIIGLSYRILLGTYLMREAKQQMRKEGRIVAESLKDITLQDINLRNRLSLERRLNISGAVIESKLVVLNSNRQIVYSNLEATEKSRLREVFQSEKIIASDYVFERLPIRDSRNRIQGYIILMTKSKDISSLTLIMRRTQFLSFIIAGLIAGIISFVLQKRLTKPIKGLIQHMKEFSVKESHQSIHINTGDEIQELAESFNYLAKRIKQYDEQQKRFLQNTSHELKTPLMSIQGYAEAIKDGVVEGEALEESLDIIIKESKRLKRTVDELIYLTRLEIPEESFNTSIEAIDEIIHEAIRSVKVLSEERGIKIFVSELINCEGLFDGEKLLRCFINLFSNCLRYAKSLIEIKCVVQEGNVIIEIIDDGEGFIDGEETRIFDRFYKGKQGNTGIGLSICKAVVEGHGGKISAYNHPVYGAAFKIELPLRHKVRGS